MLSKIGISPYGATLNVSHCAQHRHPGQAHPDYTVIVGSENAIVGTDCGLGGRVSRRPRLGQIAHPCRRRSSRLPGPFGFWRTPPVHERGQPTYNREAAVTMILLRTSTQVQGRPRMKSITCGHRWFRRCGVFSPSLSSWNTPRFPYSGPGLPEGASPRCWVRKAIDQCLIDIEDDQRKSGHSTKTPIYRTRIGGRV